MPRLLRRQPNVDGWDVEPFGNDAAGFASSYARSSGTGEAVERARPQRSRLPLHYLMTIVFDYNG